MLFYLPFRFGVSWHIVDRCENVTRKSEIFQCCFMVAIKELGKTLFLIGQRDLAAEHYGCSYVAKIHFIYLLSKKCFMFSKKCFIFSKKVFCYQKSLLCYQKSENSFVF